MADCPNCPGLRAQVAHLHTQVVQLGALVEQAHRRIAWLQSQLNALRGGIAATRALIHAEWEHATMSRRRLTEVIDRRLADLIDLAERS